MRFTDRMVPEVFQTFWAAMARGVINTDAAAEAGTYRRKGAGWLAAAGVFNGNALIRTSDVRSVEAYLTAGFVLRALVAGGIGPSRGSTAST